jgi:hypothetical protein
MRDVVVTPVQYSGSQRRYRNFEERLIVRFPGLFQRWAGLAWRLLSPGSRLRRAILRRSVRSGRDAASRRDFELLLPRYAHDAEVAFDPGFQALGVGEPARGHRAMVEAYRTLSEAWGWEGELCYIVDLGDRVLNLGFMHAQGRASGVKLDREVAQLVTLRDGLITREQLLFGWEEGLRAAGLDPDAVALPVRGKTSQAASSAG